jgi:RNA recognition motif-containing protein
MLKSLSATDLTTMSDTSASLQHSNVYVKHLPNEVASEAAVRELFQQYGPIECVRLVVRPAQLNLMRSFAFVKFRHLEDAANAITALDGTELQGSVLEVKAADADAGDRKPVSPPCSSCTPPDGVSFTLPAALAAALCSVARSACMPAAVPAWSMLCHEGSMCASIAACGSSSGQSTPN